MNKLLAKIVIALILLPVFSLPVQALKLSPETANTSRGQEVELELIATPDVKVTGVEVRLDVYGGKVISYTPTAGNLALGACDNEQNMFDDDSICVDIVNKDGVFNGDTLGKITIKLTTNKLNVVTAGNNSYTVSNTGITYINHGLVGSYGKEAEDVSKIGTTNSVEPKNQTKEDAEGTLKDDVIIDNSTSIDYSVAATAVFAIGGLSFLVIMYLRKRRSNKNAEVII